MNTLNSRLSDRFKEVDQFLIEHQHWWKIRAFEETSLPWRQEHPEFSTALSELTDNQMEQFQSDENRGRAWLQSWIPTLEQIDQLTKLPQATPKSSPDIHPSFYAGIPGRKWMQMCAITEQIPKSKKPLLEWCAGKGYLGRLVNKLHNRPIISLEWQESLCHQGALFADKYHSEQEFRHLDAFSESAAELAKCTSDAVALHACGDLHTSLMKHWASSEHTETLTVSPCCYHLTQHTIYQPLSQRASESSLKLSKVDLSLPLHQTVTGGQRAKKLRNIEMTWRMAFAEWYRSHHPDDPYKPLPAIKSSQLNGHFDDFMNWATDHHQLNQQWVPSEGQLWLNKGVDRAGLIRKMELVSHQFRRVLELWLVLDRALFLEENGATVNIKEFCEFSITPRNIAICANKRRS